MQKYKSIHSGFLFCEGDLRKLYGAIFSYFSEKIETIENSEWFKVNFINLEKEKL